MIKNWPFALFRALTSFIFLYAGSKHLLHADKIFGRIKQCSLYQWMPNEALFTGLVVVSGAVMIIAALLLLIGKAQKWAAIVLLLVLGGITFTIQLEDLADLGPFFKNVAIAGSLLLIIQYKQHERQKA